MNTTMQDLIRAFRDLPGKHVFMTAKLEKQRRNGENSLQPRNAR
jgi:hypothetical protein